MRKRRNASGENAARAALATKTLEDSTRRVGRGRLAFFLRGKENLEDSDEKRSGDSSYLRVPIYREQSPFLVRARATLDVSAVLMQ